MEEYMVGLILGGMGIVLVMIPVVGFTLRYAIKPVVEPIVGAIREARQSETFREPELEHRLVLMQEDLDEVREAVKLLVASQRFDRDLIKGAAEDRPARPSRG